MIYTQKTDNTELTDVFYNYGNTYLERNLNSVDYIVKLFVGTNLLMKSFILYLDLFAWNKYKCEALI